MSLVIPRVLFWVWLFILAQYNSNLVNSFRHVAFKLLKSNGIYGVINLSQNVRRSDQMRPRRKEASIRSCLVSMSMSSVSPVLDLIRRQIGIMCEKTGFSFAELTLFASIEGFDVSSHSLPSSRLIKLQLQRNSTYNGGTSMVQGGKEDISSSIGCYCFVGISYANSDVSHKEFIEFPFTFYPRPLQLNSSCPVDTVCIEGDGSLRICLLGDVNAPYNVCCGVDESSEPRYQMHHLGDLRLQNFESLEREYLLDATDTSVLEALALSLSQSLLALSTTSRIEKSSPVRSVINANTDVVASYSDVGASSHKNGRLEDPIEDKSLTTDNQCGDDLQCTDSGELKEEAIDKSGIENSNSMFFGSEILQSIKEKKTRKDFEIAQVEALSELVAEMETELILQEEQAVEVYARSYSAMQLIRTIAKLLDQRLREDDGVGREMVESLVTQSEYITDTLSELLPQAAVDINNIE